MSQFQTTPPPVFSGTLPGSPAVLLSADWPDWLDQAAAILRRAARSAGIASRWAAGRLGMRDRRAVLGAVLGLGEKSLRGLTRLLVDGSSTLRSWLSGMRSSIGAHHVAGAAALLGRRKVDDLDDGERTDLDEFIDRQLDYLERFAGDIRTGRELLGPKAEARAAMYAAATWQVAHNVMLRRAVRDQRYTEGRRLLGSGHPCSVCLAEAARGWVPIASLRPLGDSECGSRCRCHLEVRGSGVRPVTVGPSETPRPPGGLQPLPPRNRPILDPSAPETTFTASDRARDNREKVVWIAVDAFDRAWRNDESYYVGPQGRGTSAVEGRYREFEEFLRRARESGTPIEMPQVYVDRQGNVSFLDGRHRFAVLRDDGAKALPVTVPREVAELLARLFGAGKG